MAGYRKYRLRNSVPGKKSLEVTFPYEVAERKAREQGLTIDEFMAQFQVVAQIGNFDGVRYTFEKIE